MHQTESKSILCYDEAVRVWQPEVLVKYDVGHRFRFSVMKYANCCGIETLSQVTTLDWLVRLQITYTYYIYLHVMVLATGGP